MQTLRPDQGLTNNCFTRKCDLEQCAAQANRYGLVLCVVGQCCLSQLATDTAFLETAEGKLVVQHVVAFANVSLKQVEGVGITYS